VIKASALWLSVALGAILNNLLRLAIAFLAHACSGRVGGLWGLQPSSTRGAVRGELPFLLGASAVAQVV